MRIPFSRWSKQVLDPILTIETARSREELAALLRPLEPWRVNVQFSNGFSTKELKTYQPFIELPLQKLGFFIKTAGEQTFQKARVLDIGFNAGYNGIALSKHFGCEVVGIDISKRNLEKATLLSSLAGISQTLKLEDAQTYIDAKPFDIVLHLGTLYHLRDPVLSMQSAAKNTKPGGHLFLETTTYQADDPMVSKFIFGMNGDKTNFWALGAGVVSTILGDAGFVEVKDIKTVIPATFKGTGLARTLYIARKR
jgi:2-polyprenyl-3-methyl-5-hydroxy-6-metoxy-1,4-benzoquinol methylase